LGWNPGTQKEIYTLEEFIQDFSLEKIHTTDLVSFDRDRLNWINGYYIRQLSPEAFYKSYIDWANKFKVEIPEGFKDIGKGTKVLQLIQERVRKFSEISDMVGYFFVKPNVDRILLGQYASEANPKDILTNFWLFYKNAKDWDKESLDRASHDFLKEKGYKPKEAFMTIRIAVTGMTATPPLFDTLEFIGRNEVLDRLESALRLLN